MISRISIKNFKSIVSASCRLGEFNVLVGANGSGKSNLIKCLDFVSDITKTDLGRAVNIHGGFEGIIPKKYSRKEYNRKRIEIDYDFKMPSIPVKGNKQPDYFTVNHGFELANTKTYPARVMNEWLHMEKIRSLALFISTGLKEGVKKDEVDNDDTSFFVSRGSQGAIDFNVYPNYDSLTNEQWLEWFNLQYLRDKNVNIKEILDIIKRRSRVRGEEGQYLDKRKENNLRKYHTFTDPSFPFLLDNTAQFYGFSNLLGGIRRYDLVLSNLRSEQKVDTSNQLSADGNNVPTILRDFVSDPSWKPSLNRIIDSFSAIAPHINGMEAKDLRTGKEFIEFIEEQTGRGVESWESSDGSLRALSIMLAVESHPRLGTVLIEEPEQNLHPWAIRTLVAHLKEVAKERSLQVIITTHSQQVLEVIDPENLIIASRTKEDGTVFNNLCDLMDKDRINMGEIGRLWVKGLLGGVPDYE